MQDENTEKEEKTILDIRKARIRKKIIEETDPECRDAVEDFLKKYKDDTLTGL